MTYQHVGLGDFGTAGETGPGSGVRGFLNLGRVVFAVALLAWAAMGLTMWLMPQALADVWKWVSDLPFVAGFVAWVVALPWMAGLAIWQTDWPELGRALANVGLAWVTLWTLYPRSRL